MGTTGDGSASATITGIVAFIGSFLLAVSNLRKSTSMGVIKRSSSQNAESHSKRDVLQKRRNFFSKSQSVSYENSDPLMIMRGEGSRLIDEKGISYLDTRNNVAHCGHAHPRVAKAVQEQVTRLNTNTRYLHPTVTELAERLVGLLPDPLDVVFFCNSGSEANDMALRLARAYSGGSKNTIVVDGAYHGHTIATLEVSPYKYEHEPVIEHQLVSPVSGIGFSSPGKHIWKVPCPDTYRGKYRDPILAGKQYSVSVKDACQHYKAKGEKVRAFIIEGGMSVAGVVVPPPGYLETSVKAVHAAGGLYISDEVQTGFGRLGSVMWAFQYNSDHNGDSVVPDIVTVGKPFGNGMPLAAVVTNRKVAKAFEDCNVEYFNTFGGNPVCAAAGLAVLNVLRDENLMNNALEVGTHLRQSFLDLKDKKGLGIIGDVRGSGLFLGVDLVRDDQTREPATAETSFICSVLKSKYNILTSIDGPFNNVLVIKPPMVFSLEDANYFIDSFEKVLRDDLPAAVDVHKYSNTPT